MTGKERSSYIREALRFYYKFGDELKVISKGVKDIAKKIDNVDFSSPTSIKEENENEVEISESEEMLIDSIQDLLCL